jgi:hypothetical protein
MNSNFLPRKTISLAVCAWLLLLPAIGQTQAQQRIWAEATVENAAPYVDQNIIYTVRVYSVPALKRIEITPPEMSGVVIEELDGPTASYQSRNGTRYIVNQYRFALTPIVPGDLEIAPTHMTVTANTSRRWGSPQTPYNSWSPQPRQDSQGVKVETKPLALEVQPPQPEVQPWLPLEGLRLETRWAPHSGIRRGEPLNLTIVMTARGARGEQLPSLAPLLVSSDFKAYPARPAETDWQFGRDGKSLLGRRIETYTVVPTRDGTLRMPPISVSWWNVAYDRRSVTALPTGGLDRATRAATGASDATDQPPTSLWADLTSRHTLLFFFLPIGVALLVAFLIGWWIGSGYTERRSALRVLRDGIKGLGAGIGTGIGRVGRRAKALVPAAATERIDDLGKHLNPGAALEPAVGAVLSRMPLRAKVWWCTRCVGKEREPAKMCEFVRKFACAHLKMPANAPLREIGDGIARERPGPEANTLRKLLAELDEAVYGNLRLDVAHWQRSFRRKFLQAFSKRKPEPGDFEERGLPDLNP